MDRSWMYGRRDSVEFLQGVEEFCTRALQYQNEIGGGEIYCPCFDCENVEKFNSTRVIRDHIIRRGFRQQYDVWLWHGESVNVVKSVGDNVRKEQSEVFEHESPINEGDRDDDLSHNVDVEVEVEIEDDVSEENVAHEENEEPEDHFNEMLDGVEDELRGRPHIFESLSEAADKPLYPGCTNYSKLSGVATLFNLKMRGGWTDASFTWLLEALQDMFPKGNELPKSTYYAKKLMCPLGLDYEKIDACPNDCVLYRNENADLVQCPRCGTSRFRLPAGVEPMVGVKAPPSKVLWYLPIIPRFRRLFSLKGDAKNLRWHVDHRKGKEEDGMLRHPSDSPQWKTINTLYPQFGNEDRNLRLGLFTDGMNPFGSLSTQHSTWPVMLVIYNLPPWLCMKRKYIMLSLLISGPKQPGNDIDVYLAPLIDDLKRLWEEGVTVFDAYANDSFTMRAMLFCTINDFPAYGNLSGYKVKGKKACPICEDGMDSLRLRNSRKNVYMNSRRFLNRWHPYRKKKVPFNGQTEERRAPRPLSGKEVYDRVKDIQMLFGKGDNGKESDCLWKKRSIFFKLEYWKDLDVRHCLDVMHIEKNVCDAILGTLLNISGKTKDGLNVRRDMEEMNIRPNLWVKESKGESQGEGKGKSIGKGKLKGKGKQNKEMIDQLMKEKRTSIYLPPACYTLSKEEKRIFCECLYGIKVPTGYASNLRRIVSLSDFKLTNMKSHDSHMMMQVFLPIAIRGILPKHVRHAITRLCSFFNTICNKVLNPEKLDALQNDIIITLCQFEMYFPPSFFDIMIHLVIHLVREIKLCGPVFLRWAYPFERHMGTLQDKVRNPAHPESSIVVNTVTEEIGEFISEFMSKLGPIGLPISRHEGRLGGVGIIGKKEIMPSQKLRDKAHLYILHHVMKVHPYLDRHLRELACQFPDLRERDLTVLHNQTFIQWFRTTVFDELSKPNNVICNTLRWLAFGPREMVLSWEGYDVNGYTFYTERQDKKSTSIQNSGVTLEASSTEYSSANDNSPMDATQSYYGIIEDIWELDYSDFQVTVFNCKWADISRRGLKRDNCGFNLLKMDKWRENEEPFILASQAKQVFYIGDKVEKGWSVIVQGKRYILGISDVVDEDEYDRFDDSSPFSIPENESLEGTDVETNYMRSDHQEGITVQL